MIGAEHYTTDTSQWTLAIHRVTTTEVEIWVGTLFPELEMPLLARVDVEGPAGEVLGRTLRRHEWQRPFRQLTQRFFALVRVEGLRPGTRYRARFCRRIEAIPDVRPQSWQDLRAGWFDTLPSRLPGPGDKPFVVGFGSCFYHHRDGDQAASSYKALYDRGAPATRPDITFLTGDQVYLDIGFDSLSLVPDEIRQRIAHDYAANWRALGAVLNRGGTWLLPDDHEFWNDYPFHDSLIPTLAALKLSRVRRAWEACARDGVVNVLRARPVDTFAVGGALSFCVADLRSHRSARGFARADALDRICHWAESLACPGVLVTSQPLIAKPGLLERNLANFPGQYHALLQALGASGHDIVVLSGDAHYGRVGVTGLGPRGARLVEVLASPLSNLTGLNGLGTAVADGRPALFPAEGLVPEGWPRARVEYDSRFRVSARRGRLMSAYPRARTREHFMTAGFTRRDGAVEMVVHAWRVRERTGRRNLPVRDFARPFRCRLR